MIGAKEYLRKKIERGYNLWEADREHLIRLLDDAILLPPPSKIINNRSTMVCQCSRTD